MFKEIFFLFQSDDRAWAEDMKRRDAEAAEKLKAQLARGRKEHPKPKVTVYNPPEPDVPPLSGTTKLKPVGQTGSTMVAHISESLDRKQDGD